MTDELKAALKVVLDAGMVVSKSIHGKQLMGRGSAPEYMRGDTPYMIRMKNGGVVEEPFDELFEWFMEDGREKNSKKKLEG